MRTPGARGIEVRRGVADGFGREPELGPAPLEEEEKKQGGEAKMNLVCHGRMRLWGTTRRRRL